MSRPFRDKNKDLVNLRVASADEVWTKDRNGNHIRTVQTYYVLIREKQKMKKRIESRLRKSSRQLQKQNCQ